MHALIPILVILCIAGVGYWATDMLGVPAPLNNIAKVIIVIAAVLAIASKLGVGI